MGNRILSHCSWAQEVSHVPAVLSSLTPRPAPPASGGVSAAPVSPFPHTSVSPLSVSSPFLYQGVGPHPGVPRDLWGGLCVQGLHMGCTQGQSPNHWAIFPALFSVSFPAPPLSLWPLSLGGSMDAPISKLP